MPIWFAGFVLLYVVAVIVCVWPFLWNMPYGDDGTQTYNAYLSAQGKVPYRDFFDFIWPLTFWLGGFLFKISGFSLVFLHAVITVFFLFLIGGTVVLFKPFLPWRWLALLMLLLWMPILPDMLFQWNHHLISVTTAMMTLLYLYKPLKEAYYRRQNDFAYTTPQLIAGGVLAGMVMLGTQSLGFILGCALSVFLLMYAYATIKPQGWAVVLKPLCFYWLGFLAPLMVTFLVLIVLGAWDDFVYDTITWVFYGGYIDTTTQGYFEGVFVRLVGFLNQFWLGLTHNPSLIKTKLISALIRLPVITWLPVLGLLWGVYIHRKVFVQRGTLYERLQRCHWPILFLLCAGMALYLATLSNMTAHLMAFHWWVPLGLALVAIHSLHRHWASTLVPAPSQKGVRQVSLGVFALGLVVIAYVGFWPLINDTQVFMKDTKIASYGLKEDGLLLNYWPVNGAGVNEIVQYIHQNSSDADTIYAFAHSPAFYMLTNRANPTKFQWVLKGLITDAQREESVADIQAAKPAFVIYDYRDKYFFQYDLRAQHLHNVDYRWHELMTYVETHYRLAIKVEGQFMLFERRYGAF